MKFTVLTSLAILLGGGYAFAADTNAGTAGRPGAVLTADECVAAWHGSAGDELARLGHAIEDENAALARGGFGGGQGIMIDPSSAVYWGGSDRRKDGCAIGF